MSATYVQDRIKANRERLNLSIEKRANNYASAENQHDRAEGRLQRNLTREEVNYDAKKRLNLLPEKDNSDTAVFGAIDVDEYNYEAKEIKGFLQNKIADKTNLLNSNRLENTKQSQLGTAKQNRLGVNRYLPPINLAIEQICGTLNKLYPDLGILTRQIFINTFDPVTIEAIAEKKKFFRMIVNDDLNILAPPILRVNPGETPEQFTVRMNALRQQNLQVFVNKCSALVPNAIVATAQFNAGQTAAAVANVEPAEVATQPLGTVNDGAIEENEEAISPEEKKSSEEDEKQEIELPKEVPYLEAAKHAVFELYNYGHYRNIKGHIAADDPELLNILSFGAEHIDLLNHKSEKDKKLLLATYSPFELSVVENMVNIHSHSKRKPYRTIYIKNDEEKEAAISRLAKKNIDFAFFNGIKNYLFDQYLGEHDSPLEEEKNLDRNVAESNASEELRSQARKDVSEMTNKITSFYERNPPREPVGYNTLEDMEEEEEEEEEEDTGPSKMALSKFLKVSRYLIYEFYNERMPTKIDKRNVAIKDLTLDGINKLLSVWQKGDPSPRKTYLSSKAFNMANLEIMERLLYAEKNYSSFTRIRDIIRNYGGESGRSDRRKALIKYIAGIRRNDATFFEHAKERLLNVLLKQKQEGRLEDTEGAEPIEDTEPMRETEPRPRGSGFKIRTLFQDESPIPKKVKMAAKGVGNDSPLLRRK